MSTSIKVELPHGCAEKNETFKCDENSTIKEVVNKITSDLHLSLPDLWGLYIPATKDAPAKWLEPTSTVADNKLSKVTSVLKRNYVQIPTTFYNGNFLLKVIAYPVFVPLGEWLPYVAHKFGLNSVDDFNLYIIGKPDPLPEDKALKDISLPDRSRFLFKNSANTLDPTSMKIFHDIQEKQHNRGTKQKQESTDIPLDLDLSADVDKEAAAATLLINLPLNGYLTMLKKKKWERCFCILIAYHLFFYKSPNDPKPTLVLPLIEYTYSLIDEKKKKIQFGIDIISNDKKEVFTTRGDNQKWQQIWYDAMIKGADEAKFALEEKKHQLQSNNGKPKVFNAPLEDQVEVKDGSELPKIIPMCIEYIEERALDCEGIFRLSGSAVLIQEYKAKFDNHEQVSFENESDPHAISGLFKLYFRELPEPVMTWHQYDDFIIADGIPNPGLRLRYMKYLIDRLPPINRAILRTLVSFLRKVNERSHINKMPIHNIATVFGPNLLRQKDANMLQMVEDTAQINSLVNILINYDGYLLNDRPPPEESEEEQMIGVFAKSIYDYDGTGEDDLVFKKNAIISVIIQGVDGWSKGECDGKFGKFPASYVQVLSGEELKKNMRRVRFKQDMIRLKKAFVDEDKLLDVLQNQKNELQIVQKDLNEQYAGLEKIYIELAAPVVKSVSKEICENFSTKLHKLHENITALNLLHDEIADSRHDLREEVKEARKEITSDKDKKRKLDKKQEKAVENILSLFELLETQFTEEQRLHRNVVKNESEISQHLIPMGQLSNFFSQI